MDIEREISLDTETTGFKPQEGHRLVEIGCVEMVNRIPTGEVFHVYINPERDMPIAAQEVHGLSQAFLRDKPKFVDVADDFLRFIGNSKLIIHNAQFDMNFLNAELTHIKRRNILNTQVFCTLQYARKKFPGSPASLDALCKRFGVDNSARTKHGALLDAELLADMYLELMGGAQVGMSLDGKEPKSASNQDEDARDKKMVVAQKPVRPAREFSVCEEEIAAHAEFVEGLGDDAAWKKWG